MKTFSVTIRDKAGHQEVIQVEAEDRKGVFPKLAQQGVSVVRIEELDGKVKVKKSRKQRSGGIVRGVVAGVIIVVVAMVALYCHTSRAKAPVVKKEKPAAKIAEVKPSVPVRNESPEALPEKEDAPVESNRVLIEARTNSTSGVIIERWRSPDGTTHRRMINPPPIFSNACDQVIAMVVGSHAGQRIPPLPPMRPGQLDKAFAESLLQPITIGEKDKPEVAALKLAVKAIRGEIAEAIKSGDTRGVAEILQDHVAQVNFNADLRGEAIQQLRAIANEGDAAFAKEYLEKVNENLVKYGIEPIKMPTQSTERKQ